MNPALRRRRGMIIPLVLIALIVMALLGTWLMWSSTSHYQQTGKVAASVKCAEVLAAASEEARAIIYDRLNRPVPAGQPAPAWHTELESRLTGTPGTGVLVTHDLKAESLVPRTRAIASAMGCEVTSAAVQLCWLQAALGRIARPVRGPQRATRRTSRSSWPRWSRGRSAPAVKWWCSTRSG